VSDTMTAQLDNAERARDAVHDRAVRHAQLRVGIATALLRAVVPSAAQIAAHIEPGTVPSISDIIDGNGDPIPETDWVDGVSDVEEQLSYALDYCDPETAGWRPDDGDRRYTLQLAPRAATRPLDTAGIMSRLTIRVDTANPHAWDRLTALLADPALLGRDDAAGLHTTSIAVLDQAGHPVWDRRVDATDPEVLAAELAHIVRVYRQHPGPQQDRLDRVEGLVLALTVRLLHAVGIDDPDSDPPLPVDRVPDVAADLCGLLQPPPPPPRSLPRWVAEHILATCQRVADQWLANLADRAGEIAVIQRDPTSPSYLHAAAHAEHARTTWPAALRYHAYVTWCTQPHPACPNRTAAV
jgi:hypothetical protein